MICLKTCWDVLSLPAWMIFESPPPKTSLVGQKVWVQCLTNQIPWVCHQCRGSCHGYRNQGHEAAEVFWLIQFLPPSAISAAKQFSLPYCLRKSSGNWSNSTAQEAFACLKQSFTLAPVLKHPDPMETFWSRSWCFWYGHRSHLVTTIWQKNPCCTQWHISLASLQPQKGTMMWGI